jgi:hypothetical protein
MVKICGVADIFECTQCAFWSKTRKCLVFLEKNEFMEIQKCAKENNEENREYERNRNIRIQFGK